MGIFYYVHPRKHAKLSPTSQRLRLFQLIYDRLFMVGSKDRQQYPTISPCKIKEFLFWPNSPMYGITEPEEISINETNDPADVGEILKRFKKNARDHHECAIEIYFSQTFTIPKKMIKGRLTDLDDWGEFQFEGSLMVDQSVGRIADVKIQFFPINSNKNFDFLWKQKSFRQYFQERLIFPFIHDPKDKRLVSQVNVGEYAYPRENVIEAKFVFTHEHQKFLENLLRGCKYFFNHRIESSQKEHLLTIYPHIKEFIDNYSISYTPEFILSLLSKHRVRYNQRESLILGRSNITPSLAHSYEIVKEDFGTLKDGLLELSNFLTSMYTDYYRPIEQLDEVIKKHLGE